MENRALTGIKPTGTPHLGNYLGTIKPSLELAHDYKAIYFVADYHALTILKNPQQLRQLTVSVAATWLALGLEPTQVIFFRQSDIPEVFELTWILACLTAKGMLNRAHAYKAARDENFRQNRSEDEGINAGLFNYPILMAADILLFRSHVIPVGQDQRQHVEIARDLAIAFNRTYQDVLTVPVPHIKETVKTITGLDGRKMSKSYNNTIPIFSPSKVLRKQVMRIVTDSRQPEEPKDPDQCNIFAIYRHLASPEDVAAKRQEYLNGGVAYGAMKEELYELIDGTFAEARRCYNALVADCARIDAILSAGAEKARDIAMPMIHQIRDAVGV